MSELNARGSNRWIAVICWGVVIVVETVLSPYLGLTLPWSDPDRTSRLLRSVVVTIAVVQFVMECRRLVRSKTS